MVTAVCVDDQAVCVVLGDSSGHLRVYDISGGVDTSSSTAASASFKQVRCAAVAIWLCGDHGQLNIRHACALGPGSAKPLG